MLGRSFPLVVCCIQIIYARPSSIVWKVDLEGFLTPPLDASENKTTTHIELQSEQVTFFLYSRSYKGVRIKDAPEKERNAHLLGRYPSVPIKVIIHGWMSSHASEWVQTMTSAYMKLPKSMNVILVNWEGLANDTRYYPAVLNTEMVGIRVAQFLNNLQALGLAKGEQIHLIGHSLGAHIAGVAGHHFKGKISRITGLDPALPGYEIADGPEILDKEDAELVDIIHTAAGTSGIFNPLGHADFYPNGGVNQPGCDGYSPNITNYIESVQCGHMRACEFYIESIRNYKGFVSRVCYENVTIPPKADECEEEVSTVQMGERCPKSAKGIFILETKENAPYSKNNLALTKETATSAPVTPTKKADIFSSLDDIFNFGETPF